MYRQRNLALETTSRSGPPARHDGRHYLQWNAYSQGFSSQSQRLRTPTRSPTTSRSRDVLAGEVRRRRNDSHAEHQFVRRAKARPLRLRRWEKVIFLFSFTFFSFPSKSFPRVEIQQKEKKRKSSQCRLTKKTGAKTESAPDTTSQNVLSPSQSCESYGHLKSSRVPTQSSR